MKSIQVYFVVEQAEINNGIIISDLSEIGYEGFWEIENGLNAYITEKDFIKSSLQELSDKYDFIISFETEILDDINWNAEWESNYEAIEVDDKCLIRSPFHEGNKDFLYEVIIMPQMSFGTGHHDTTYLMVKNMMNEDLVGKSMLDMGCGTAVLAILAKKQGADEIWAIDNDHWAYENSVSNCKKNNAESIVVIQGDAYSIPEVSYDLILANINKNILKADISEYVKHLKNNGVIFFSGFFGIDIDDMKESIEQHGLVVDFTDVKNEWAFIKCTLTK